MVSAYTWKSAVQARDYYDRDNYYSKDDAVGQEGSAWFGKGAAELGLAGEVDHDTFLNLLDGKSPEGEDLVEGSRANGDKHRPGMDVTFSAPKWASVMSEVLGVEEVRQAHDEAVRATLSYLEEEFSRARVTRDGDTQQETTGNLVVATFRHDTSRELDPQLHTHAMLMNITQRSDGEWRALSNEEIYRNKMLLGQLYRNELAANLQSRGYVIDTDEKGFLHLRGFSEEVTAEFSRRREQIEARAQELQDAGQYPAMSHGELMQVAALGSRTAKKDVDRELLGESWNARLAEMGVSKESLLAGIERSDGRGADRGERATTAQRVIEQAAMIVTETHSTFSKGEVLNVAAKLGAGVTDIGSLRTAWGALTQDDTPGTLVRVQSQTGMFTTREMQRVELQSVHMMEAGKGRSDITVDAATLDQQLDGAGLTRGQEEAARLILTSPDRVVGIQGDAGTGKTTMLQHVRQILETDGVTVRGFGFTGKAADELKTQAGIQSDTVHRFLGSRDRAEGTERTDRRREVWVLDEASLLGSKQMHQLLVAAEEIQAKVVLVGDIKQLTAIAAGKSFADFQAAGMVTAKMQDVVRQQGDYKAIVDDFARDRFEAGFAKLEQQGRLHEVSDRAERMRHITQAYLNEVAKGRETLVVTSRNADRTALNEMIREELKRSGRLASDDVGIKVREAKNISTAERQYGHAYSVGDIITVNVAGGGMRAGSTAYVESIDRQRHTVTLRLGSGEHKSIDLKTIGRNLAVYEEKTLHLVAGDAVVFLKNDRKVGVRNGETGVVERINKDGSISVKGAHGKITTFNQRDYNYLSHGYAITNYKSQGQTIKSVIVHGVGEGTSYNSFYVQVTRGKQNLQVYTDSKERLRDAASQKEEKRSTLDIGIKQADKGRPSTDRKGIGIER